MNILQFEEQRRYLISQLNNENCTVARLILYTRFFANVLSTKDNAIIESFITEFEDQYLFDLSNFNVIGLEPEFSESIIDILNTLVANEQNILRNRESLKKEADRILNDTNDIQNSLIGNNDFNYKNISFPVNIVSSSLGEKIGQIENISVRINSNKTLKNDNFIIIPSIQKVDIQLKEQIEISWEIAVKYLSTVYKKINEKHDVIIIFERKFAYYEGYSLGMALTLGFIQELFKFYNTQFDLQVNKNSLFTGGVDKFGKVIKIGKAINEKVKTAFYSTVNIFALPEIDYENAKGQLELLKLKYPERKLKLVRIEDFEDLLNHRNLVLINKTPIITRSKKYLKKNILVISLYLMLISIVAFISIKYKDTNPVEFQHVGDLLNILNKEGDILWSTKAPSFKDQLSEDPKFYYRIFDIDKDGINEVILSHEYFDDEKRDMENQGRIACFDKSGEQIWTYKFKDTVSTISETYKDEYNSRLVDIVNINGINTLICNARHLYFPSAIYKLDVKTGKRLPGTLWSQGHFHGGQIGDFNEDGKLQLFIGGVNNGSESAFALIINLDDIKGQTPTVKNYMFKNIPIGKFTKYFLFPKTDICRLNKNRFNNTELTYFFNDTRTYKIGVNEKYPYKPIGQMYVINQKLDSAWLQIGDDLQFTRDSLIIKGILQPPFTNDKEYEKIVVSGIQEWDGKRFVPFMKKEN